MSLPPIPASAPTSAPSSAAGTGEQHARQKALADWIQNLAAAQGLVPSSLVIASADASFRRYWRISTATGQTRIIMDAPPDKENCAPFVHVAQLMADAGLNAPEVLAWDEPQGFMLLTDLGTHTLMTAFEQATPGLAAQDVAEAASDVSAAQAFLPRAAGPADLAYFSEATDLLIQWQLASRPNELPPYDEALLRRELALFPEWYIGAHRQYTLTPSQQGVLDAAFGQIVANNLAAPSVYVHRDFMARNLMLPSTSASSPSPSQGHGRLGVLDFQDAVYGPMTYDIASLMRDAFITWEEPYVLDVTVRYWEKARQVGLMDFEDWHSDFGAFYRSVEWMGLQRHLKVAGIFARLTLRDGKPRYLADTPRFIQYIRETCNRYRALGPLLKLIDEIENIPTAMGYAFGRI